MDDTLKSALTAEEQAAYERLGRVLTIPRLIRVSVYVDDVVLLRAACERLAQENARLKAENDRWLYLGSRNWDAEANQQALARELAQALKLLQIQFEHSRDDGYERCLRERHEDHFGAARDSKAYAEVWDLAASCIENLLARPEVQAMLKP